MLPLEDAAHRPHVAMAFSYVRTTDHPKVYAVPSAKFWPAPIRWTGLKLEAYKYYYIPVG